MKRIFFQALICLSIVVLVTAKGLAVWPPSTSLENEANPETIGSTEATKMAAPDRLHTVVQKLEEDERQLAELIRQLEKEKESFKENSKVKTSDQIPTPSQGDRGTK